MEIKCTDKTTFVLTDSSKELGHITYRGLFSSTAAAVAGKEQYSITPTGIFSTTISVSNNGSEVASLAMNWKGNIVIAFQSGRQFILKPTGTFANKYVLEDEHGHKLMLLNPHFDWSKFIYNYRICYDHKPDDILLVLLAAYAANYYITVVSAVL